MSENMISSLAKIRAYTKQIGNIYKSITTSAFNSGGDSVIMILHPADIIMDGSFIQQDDAQEVYGEAMDGWSWHWADVVGMDESKMVYL